MDKKKLGKNAVIGFGSQLCIIICGFIVPKIFISNYGSDINGLLGTIGQVFAFLALMEAGVGQAARNALYKPFLDHDENAISEVVSISQNYYKRIGVYYLLSVILLSFVLPFVIKTNVDFFSIFLIVIFEGISGVISFYYTNTYNVVLSVDGKAFINNYVDLACRLAAYILRIILASNGVNIILLQSLYLVLTIIKALFYKYYFDKNYSWICIKFDVKNKKLSDRNSYLITQGAWIIFSSTDLIVLSTILGTQYSSIYSVYNMVFLGIHNILSAIYSNISYILGIRFREGIKSYEPLHDLFMSCCIGAMTILMSISYHLIIPFVKLYTQGIADVNYIYTELPIMFCLVQILSWSRYVQGNLTGLAGYAKQVSVVSLIEAGINVLLSFILVNKYGISGVLLATVIALPLKVIYTTYVSDRKVLCRSSRKSIAIIGINYIFFFVNVIMNVFVDFKINSIFDFLVHGLILSFLIGSIGIGLNILINLRSMEILHIIKRKK